MSVDIKKISTEARNPNTMNIDEISTVEALKEINNEDKTVAIAIEKQLPKIAVLVDEVVEAFKKGGRLIYMGAGTSGRIGILDAVECPPTFGVSYEMVKCLMAGGSDAFVKAKEGAEDSRSDAINDLDSININQNDFVIGIAASGRTPYVLGGMEYCKQKGIKTGCITTSLNSPLESTVDFPIAIYTGPEAITGSTRMKSGTCQKMVCNMISTCSMIKLGKVYENLMIDVKATNEKLVARSINIIKTITDCSSEEAEILFNKYHNTKKAVFAYISGEEDTYIIDKYLEATEMNLKEAIKKYHKENIK